MLCPLALQLECYWLLGGRPPTRHGLVVIQKSDRLELLHGNFL